MPPISKYPQQQNPNYRPFGTNTKLQSSTTKTVPKKAPLPMVRPDNTKKTTTPKQTSGKKSSSNQPQVGGKVASAAATNEAVKQALQRIAHVATKSKPQNSKNIFEQAYDTFSEGKQIWDNSVHGEAFRNLTNNSLVDNLYNVKDVADGVDSVINKSHGGRKTLAKFDRIMDSSKLGNTYNKLRSPASNTYHSLRNTYEGVMGRIKQPLKNFQTKLQGLSQAAKKQLTGLGSKIKGKFFTPSTATTAVKTVKNTSKFSKIMGALKNSKYIKTPAKLLSRSKAFVRLVSGGTKTTSKLVNGLRVASSGMKVVGRGCWVAAIAINVCEIGGAAVQGYKKGGIKGAVKAAAPKALQCATETACAWAGAKVGAAIGSAFGPVGTLVGGLVGGIGGYIVGSKAGKYVVAGAKKACKAVANVAKKAVNGVKTVAKKAINGVKTVAKKAVNTVKNIANGAKNLAKKAWNAIKFW